MYKMPWSVPEFLLERRLFLPRSPEEVFPFFADARNLEAITPPWLEFRILTPGPIEMRAGALIDYRLRLHGIPLYWRTKITAWEPPHRFVDEQVRGPYRRWVHEHTFTACPGGCEMRDRVRYAVPGGRWVHALLVKKEVGRIFDHRARFLEGRFGRRDGEGKAGEEAGSEVGFEG